MEKLKAEQKILSLVARDLLTPHNSRTLSKLIGISHAGAFKALKRLEKRDIVIPKRIGKAIIYSINKSSQIAIKELDLAFALEAQNYSRWLEEFKALKNKVQFAILFGSILKNEKLAKDIDLLVVAGRSNFQEIKKEIEKRNQFLTKKIHLLLQAPEEFKNDFTNKNPVTLEIIKKGVILFGQEELRRLILP